ncbi:MAG: hypothetical protein ACOYOP_10230 [Microthrixaceae bacterium]
MTEPGPVRLLVVCTANQCRSPLGEVIARFDLERRGIPAVVASAGFLQGGVPAAEGSVQTAARRGLDLRSHHSRRIDPDMLDAADVVLAMEGAHVMRLVGDWPERTDHVLTVEGAAAAARLGVPGAPLDGPGLRAWAVAAQPRVLGRVLDTTDDVPDPMHGPARAYRRTADLLADRFTVLFDAWFGRPT